MIGIKDGNGDLVSIANKSDKWAVYATKAAAEDALINGELAEGMIVGVTEKPGVVSEGSSVITSASATLPIVASGPEVEFYSYTNTTNSDVDLYASYYNNYGASQSGYYAGFYGVLNGTTIVKTGEGGGDYVSTFLYVHLRPGDTVILKGKRSNSALSATVEIDISAPTLEYVTDKLYAIEPNYSITEVNTGKKWIDGKTIYRKCYSHDGTSSVSGVLDTFTNVNIIKIEGMAHISTGVWLPFGFSGANDVNVRWNKGSNNQLLIEVGSYTLWGYNAIVEYTKTE